LRTDLSWLELRLLDPNATDAIATRRREFDRRLARTQQATSAALAEAPKDPLALRAQIDWLRMKGDSPSARSRLGPISEKASDPANAYVLAALDLSEDSPVSASLIDRLRLASSAEPGGGRAQAMLVYALALANRGSEANTELAKISANSPVSALVPSLRQFVTRTARPAKAAPTPADSAAKAPAAPTAAEKSAAEKSGAAAEKSGRGDFRKLLVEGKQAANNGQYSLAEELYLRVLELQPGNTEALAALGDIARKRKDTARAQELYERALAEDPGFAPAIRGSARLAEDREAQKRADTEPKPELPPEATTPNPSTAPTSKPELDTTDQRR
jgi:tetratricopeptide (TPR) repeat protein